MLEDATRREQRDLELLRRYHRHDDLEARDALVRRCLPLVRSVANGYRRTGEPLDDLVQAGCVGLVKAIDRFDLASGHRFVSYAIPTIQGEIRRHFRDHTWAVKVPRSMQELDARIAAHQRRVRERGGRDATVDELAEALEVDADRITDALAAGQGYSSYSLDHPSGEDRELLDTFGGPDDGYRGVEDRDVLRHAMGALDDRERFVVEQRFFGERLQREIAEDVGVSQMQVSRILSRAVETMHEHVTATAPASSLPAAA